MELDDCTIASGVLLVGNEESASSQPTLAALATHLEALTAPTSLPMALSSALDQSEEVAEGLRWINGSSITDAYTTLQLFCGEYDERNWNGLLRRLVPELSDDDCEWLSTLAPEDEHLEPSAPPLVLPPTMPPPDRSRGKGTTQEEGHTCHSGTKS
jgi:hypothetical protein